MSHIFRHIFRITRKEFGSFFSSPIAFIFIGVFLAANLFIFFWVETFSPVISRKYDHFLPGCRFF